MPLDLSVANNALSGLRPYPVAVTTMQDGRTNGLISLSGGAAGIVPEAPRAMVSITKYNYTHDLILNGGVFAIHVLGSAPEVLDESLDILMTLGGSSGRDGDKLGGLRSKPGVTPARRQSRPEASLRGGFGPLKPAAPAKCAWSPATRPSRYQLSPPISPNFCMFPRSSTS